MHSGGLPEVSGIQERISAACEAAPTTEVVERLAAVVHRVLEIVFETQGFEASRHFLAEAANPDTNLADRHRAQKRGAHSALD